MVLSIIVRFNTLAQSNSVELGVAVDKPTKIKFYPRYHGRKDRPNKTFNIKKRTNLIKLNVASDLSKLKFNLFDTTNLEISYLKIISGSTAYDFNPSELFNLINYHSGIEFDLTESKLIIRPKNLQQSSYIQFIIPDSIQYYAMQIGSISNHVQLEMKAKEKYVVQNISSIENGSFLENRLLGSDSSSLSFKLGLDSTKYDSLKLSIHRQYSPSFTIGLGYRITKSDTLELNSILEYLQLSKNLDLEELEDGNVHITYTGNNKLNSDIEFSFNKKDYQYNVDIFGKAMGSYYLQSTFFTDGKINQQHITLNENEPFRVNFKHFLDTKPNSFGFEIRPLGESSEIIIDSIRIGGLRKELGKSQAWSQKEIDNSFKLVMSPSIEQFNYYLKSNYIFNSDRLLHQVLIAVALFIFTIIFFKVNILILKRNA